MDNVSYVAAAFPPFPLISCTPPSRKNIQPSKRPSHGADAGLKEPRCLRLPRPSFAPSPFLDSSLCSPHKPTKTHLLGSFPGPEPNVSKAPDRYMYSSTPPGPISDACPLCNPLFHVRSHIFTISSGSTLSLTSPPNSHRMPSCPAAAQSPSLARPSGTAPAARPTTSRQVRRRRHSDTTR